MLGKNYCVPLDLSTICLVIFSTTPTSEMIHCVYIVKTSGKLVGLNRASNRKSSILPLQADHQKGGDLHRPAIQHVKFCVSCY